MILSCTDYVIRYNISIYFLTNDKVKSNVLLLHEHVSSVEEGFALFCQNIFSVMFLPIYTILAHCNDCNRFCISCPCPTDDHTVLMLLTFDL